MVKLKKINLLVIICVAASLAACGKKEDEIKISIDEPQEVIQMIDSQIPDELQIVCYVCGEVNSPGIYHLEEDSRIYNLIEAAGGFTEFADSENINLAQKLNDGQQVIVKSILNEESGKSSSGKVNLNYASLEELMSLPGIGESKAKAIIEYRDSIGWFSDPSQLQDISGIGEKMYGRIADLIEV